MEVVRSGEVVACTPWEERTKPSSLVHSGRHREWRLGRGEGAVRGVSGGDTLRLATGRGVRGASLLLVLDHGTERVQCLENCQAL